MQESYPNIRDGRKTVTAAGTRETLVSTNTPCAKVEITALSTNAGIVVIGGSTVVAAAGSRRGVPLQPEQTLTMYIEDLVAVYIDAEQSGDGVSYVYLF